MKYKYTGSDEKHLPKFNLTVKPGETVETEEAINHPEFELVEGEKSKSQQKREALQKGE